MSGVMVYQSDWGALQVSPAFKEYMDELAAAAKGDGRKRCVSLARKKMAQVDAAMNGLAWLAHESGVNAGQIVIR